MKTNLDFQSIKCLGLAISGTNGKSTTAGLVERMLRHNHRRTLVYGSSGSTAGSILEQTRDLDYLIIETDSLLLRRDDFFRPAVAVLLNHSPDGSGGSMSADDSVRAYDRLFRNQQFFDWAIVQSQSLARLRELGVPVPAKTITFSADDPEADLVLNRGLLVSRLSNWPGPLLNPDHCLLRGPHNAENLLAALAVGHVLRLPLEDMVDALKTFRPGPYRCELVAEMNGVQFINDAKASNLGAMEGALRASRRGPNDAPNVWLIAGGSDAGLDFHEAGPLLSQRVKGAFLIGNVSQRIRSAWSLFTPCMLAASLLEAVAEAAKNATSGDVVLFSPACSGLDQFRNYQHRGEVFCEAMKSIGRGLWAPGPYMNGVPVPAW